MVIGDASEPQQDAANDVPIATQVEHPPPLVTAPDPAPALVVAVRRAIVAIEQPAVGIETGETWRGRATSDRVRAWITAHWPDLDTTKVEEVYPAVRKTIQRERQQERQRAFWAAERARVRALDDTGLLVALGGWASKLARAEGKQGRLALYQEMRCPLCDPRRRTLAARSIAG